MHEFLHSLTKTLGESQAHVFVLETLSIKGMMRNKRLSRSFADASLSEFVRMLTYKAKAFGKVVVFVDRFFASSKICSNCDHKNADLKLSDRDWICPNCQRSHDRDENAAINIRIEGIRKLFLQCGRELPTITLS
jgi:putative transposase